MIPPEPIHFLLDFDGTLVDIADAPERVVVPPELPGVLEALRSRGDRVAVVTGRPPGEVVVRLPGVFVVGLHGLAWPGEHTSPRDPDLDRALDALGEFARVPGVWIEDKGPVLAVHWRRAGPERDLVGSQIADRLGGIAAESGGRLLLLRGRCVEELRPPAASKAVAVRRLCADAPDHVPLYAGDDSSDEEAFAALPPPAITIRVGPTEEPTLARARLDDPAALRALLAKAVDR